MRTPPAGTSSAPDVDGRNRLADETSPYLLQHKSNPVHWWPWGPEAFAAARAQDKPIFLSVGYSTCYWCHVMERECFENAQIAALMNRDFICIKVDREERPDVDDIYMSALQIFSQLTTGQAGGGWPMSIFIEPEGLKPFFAGTYYPAVSRPEFGRPSFPQILEFIATNWRDKRDELRAQADQLAGYVSESLASARDVRPVGAADVERAINQLLSVYDREDGGFGQGTNKFPTPVNLDFLMTAGWELGSVRDAVVHTLDRMAIGGMYDQIGGGFHRYSTDRKWLVPHFEKMLYDNGQLASTYAEAYERTGDELYAEVLRETLDYVRREMTGPSGELSSAQDAEVNHREGGNYIWLESEVRAALADAGLADDADFAVSVYGLGAGPNFRDQHHPGDPRNVLFLARKPHEVAAELGLPPEEFDERLRRVNAALLVVRDRRDQPLTDDKVLAGWNGLMIAGFADGGRVLRDETYVDAAERAARFILTEMRTPSGELLRTSRNGRAKIGAFLEDYAYMVRGLLALQRATGSARTLAEVTELMAAARRLFWDESGGGYFDTRPDQSDLFVRVKSTYDGATPSGNGVMLANLIRLYEITGTGAYLDDAVATVEALSSEIAERPMACVESVTALDRLSKIAPDRLATSVATRPGPAGRGAPVTLSTSEQLIRLDAGGSATFDLTLRLAPGLHLNAHEPGIDFLIPLEVTVVGGSGLEISVAYPAGEKYAGPEGDMLVHRDAVTIPITVTRVGAIEDRPRLMVTYQVCTDRECLAPETEPLPMRVIASVAR